MQTSSSRKWRIANGLFWIAVWAGIVVFTGSIGQWFFMFLQAFVPAMLWLFVHLALRPGGPEA